MLLKDEFKPVFLNEFLINKDTANMCNNIVNKKYIPHLLFYGPAGSGKYTMCKSIINSIYDKKIIATNSIFKIDGKEHTLKSSEYHFEIHIDKYSNNRTSLIPLIDYLTDTKEVNQICLTKIIIIRNINFCNYEVFSFLKNKIEISSNNYRFFVITNNISYVSSKFRGLFIYIKLKYENEDIIKKFLNKNDIKYDNKIIQETKNLNFLFVNNELNNVSKSKTFLKLKEKQIIKLIKEAINNPDNILKIRDILYEINIKNIKLSLLLRNLLKYYLSENIKIDKKHKLCELFTNYDVRIQSSYKTQIHHEALFSEIIFLLHS